MIRAHIVEADYFYGIAVTIAEHADPDGPPTRVMHWDEAGVTSWDPYIEGANVTPTFRLNESAARSLLDALTRHYSGTEDTMSLRRDYNAERSRVDKLTDALINLAAPPRNPLLQFHGGMHCMGHSEGSQAAAARTCPDTPSAP